MPNGAWSYRHILWLSVVSWLVTTTIQTLLLIQNGFDFQWALTDAVISQTLLALSISGLTFLMRYYRPGKQNLWRLFDWTLVMAIAVFMIQRYILGQWNQGEEYTAFLQRTLVVRGILDWLLIMVAVMGSWLMFYWHDQEEAEKRKVQSEQLAREAELNTLRQQLHPHFLFNSLNSISALVGSRPEEARRMIQQLSDFLRGTLRKDDTSLVSLEEELQHLRLYLDIEKVRFGHRLQVEIQCDEPSLSLKVPLLILQPLVENAIKFGLYDTVGEITIRLKAAAVNNSLQIQISNPFDPETAIPQKGTGFGLSSVRRRLFLLYSRSDLLSLSQEGKIFYTSVTIPQHA